MSKRVRAGGAALMLLAGLMGTAIAGYDYITPATGIDHTGGVILVFVSCTLMALAALVILARMHSTFVGILVFLVFLDVLGTGTAAWFLESELMLAAMVIAAVGCFFWATGRGVVR